MLVVFWFGLLLWTRSLPAPAGLGWWGGVLLLYAVSYLPCPVLPWVQQLYFITHIGRPRHTPTHAHTLCFALPSWLATRNMTAVCLAANSRRPIWKWKYARSGESHADLNFPFLCSMPSVASAPCLPISTLPCRVIEFQYWGSLAWRCPSGSSARSPPR